MHTVSPDSQQGLVPITVGVTGHRDIPKEDESLLNAALLGQLQRIANEHPNSPLVFLSGLAEGADRLAARCALSAGWQLGAVLPLPQDQFETDFDSEQSIAEFRDLLAQAAWVRVVSEPCEQVRPACYSALGHWLSRYALLLVAFWDGKKNGLAGGSAETVNEFLEGLPRDDAALPETGPVIQITTRRMRDMTTPLEVGKVIVHAPRPAGLPGEGEMDRWAMVLRRIDDFNNNSTQILLAQPEAVAAARSWLFDPECPGIELSSIEANRASWLHAVADRISFSTQTRRDKHLLAIMMLSLLAILFQQIYGGPLPQPVMLLAAIIFGILAYGVFRRGVNQRLEERYLDYRALAEAFRVQLYWKLAGIHDCAADHFLRDQRDELEWIRQAVLVSELGGSASTTPASLERLKNIRDWWIEDQRAWLMDATVGRLGKADANERLSKKWGSLAKGFVVSGMFTVFALVPFHVWVAPQFGESGGSMVGIIVAIYGLFFAVGGLCKVYQGVKAFSEQANRYRRLGLSMTLARNRLDTLLAEGDLESARNLLLNAGKTALSENSDWLLIHRARPPSVPLGG